MQRFWGLSRWPEERAPGTKGSSGREQREARGGSARTSPRAPPSLVVPPSPSASTLRSSHCRPGCSGHTDARATRPARGQPPRSSSHASSRHARLLVSGGARVPVGREVRGGDCCFLAPCAPRPHAPLSCPGVSFLGLGKARTTVPGLWALRAVSWTRARACFSGSGLGCILADDVRLPRAHLTAGASRPRRLRRMSRREGQELVKHLHTGGWGRRGLSRCCIDAI